MSVTTATINKRVLGDATNVRRNLATSPPSAKKRKLDPLSSPNRFRTGPHGPNGKISSSQPKSQFEEEVLEKLSQDINELKQKNSEKDQQWARPSLDDFDPGRDSLCFQQIDVEEGTLHGGKTTIRLFGVTEVDETPHSRHSPNVNPDGTLGDATCDRLPPLPLCGRASLLRPERLRAVQGVSGNPDGPASVRHSLGPDGAPREHLWLSGRCAEPVSEDHCQ